MIDACNSLMKSARRDVCSMLAIVGALTVACSTQAVAEESTFELRYKFQPGQFLFYEVENTNKMMSRYGEKSEEMVNYTRTWKQLRIVSVDEQGGAMLEPLIERVQMSAKWDDKTPILYDSATDEEPPMQFLAVKKSIGRVQAQFHVDPQGDLVQVTPLIKDDAALVEAAKTKDPRLNFLVVLPKGKIRIGETWKDRFKTEVTVGKNLKERVEIQRTYELAEVNGTIATIKLKSGPVTPVIDPQIKVQLMQRTPKGTIQFDLGKGVMLSMSTVVDEEVVDAFGQQTSVRATTKSLDKLLPGAPDLKSVRRITEAAAK